MKRPGLGTTALALLTDGCLSNREQSPLYPAGPFAHASRQVFEVMLPIAAVVYLAVIAALYLSLRRRDPAPESPGRERGARRVVSAAATATVAILFGVLVYDLSVAHGMSHPPPAAAVSIRLTGHQWWWEVEYQDSVAQRRVLLANEIHVPVGLPVRIELVSHDVIHSFWVPNLAGKKDLIPGHDGTVWLLADRAGRYRGQCAEFCGAQHAKMALAVVAEPVPEFDAWLERQRRPAPVPGDSTVAQGRALFESGHCALCHAVSGTPAGGRVGPDLTHVASRLTLGAGILPNTPGDLAAWIRDPQVIKPGAQMPPSSLSSQQLGAIIAYLNTLQ